MKTMNGAVLAGRNRLELSSSCPLPDKPCATGAFVRPLIWSPCTSDAHLLETEAASLKGVGCGDGRPFMERMATLISYGRVTPEKLITHRFHGMSAIPNAMRLFLDHDRSLIKAIIYNDNEGR